MRFHCYVTVKFVVLVFFVRFFAYFSFFRVLVDLMVLLHIPFDFCPRRVLAEEAS